MLMQVPHVEEKLDTYHKDRTQALTEHSKALEAKSKAAREAVNALTKECSHLAKLEKLERVRRLLCHIGTSTDNPHG